MVLSSGCGFCLLYFLVFDLIFWVVYVFVVIGVDFERLVNEIEVCFYVLNIMYIYSKMYIIINFILYFIYFLV